MLCQFVGGEHHGELLEVQVGKDGLPPSQLEMPDSGCDDKGIPKTCLYVRKLYLDACLNQSYQYHL